MKSSLQKKKQQQSSTQSQSINTSAQYSTISLMNRTSLSSISTSSQSNANKQQKLSQLKSKLQKQRQTIKSSTGRRFRQSNQSISIQTQTQSQLSEPINKQQPISNNKKFTNSKGLKVSSTAVGSSNAPLFDFGSLKSQVQNKMKGVFNKKPNPLAKQKNQPIIPVYTTKQILSMANNPTLTNNTNNSTITSNGNTKNPTLTNSNNTNNKKQSIIQNSQQQQQLKRQTVNLMQLSQVILLDNDKNDIKRDSNSQNFVNFTAINNKKNNTTLNHNKQTKKQQILSKPNNTFQTAINQQKQRNNQVKQFLSTVKLQRFADQLISLGFDQIQTLLYVTLQELNAVKMRAKEQDKLMSFIKQYKLKNGIIDNTIQEQTNILTNNSYKPINKLSVRPLSAMTVSKTQPSQTTTQHSRLRSTTTNFNPSTTVQSTLLNKSSIFYFMGSDQWSLQSQIRKACSGCFKVSYQAIKRGQCYYCDDCDPGQSGFLIQLDQSMVRNYY